MYQDKLLQALDVKTEKSVITKSFNVYFSTVSTYNVSTIYPNINYLTLVSEMFKRTRLRPKLFKIVSIQIIRGKHKHVNNDAGLHIR